MAQLKATFALLASILLLPSSLLAYTQLSNASLASLPSPGNDFNIHTGALLAPILKVRVPGTPEIEEVRQHFVNFFRNNLPLWEIQYHNATLPTALGTNLPFVNLIMSRDPPWAKTGDVGRLTLVAHYDSKLTPKGFIGATDSAAPCAMLMHVARSIDSALTKKWEHMQQQGDPELELAGDVGIQILFLDGEESFISWTDEDSLYGARSLAAEWDETMHPAMSTYHTNISSISLFVLLDLLGSANPSIPSYFPTTHWAYQSMANVETRLRRLRLLKSSPNHPSKNPQGGRPTREQLFLVDANKDQHAYFPGGGIEDDHIPFMHRGVEILHMIPMPFPRVWHTHDDDGEHLDLPTVEDWATIMTAFSAEWMDLEGFMPVAGQNAAQRRDSNDEGGGERKRDEL